MLEGIHRQLRYLHFFILYFWYTLYAAGFLFLLLFLATVLFRWPGQSRDIFEYMALELGSGNKGEFFLPLAFLSLFAVTIWFCARILYEIVPIRHASSAPEYVHRLKVILPRIGGMYPFILYATRYWSLPVGGFWPGCITMFTGIGFLCYVSLRRKAFALPPPKVAQETSQLRWIHSAWNRKILIGGNILCALLCLACIVVPSQIVVARWLGGLNILLLFMCSLALGYTLFGWLKKRDIPYWPLLIVVWIGGMSIMNNNHYIRTIPRSIPTGTLPTAQQYLLQKLQYLKQKHLHSEGKIPIFLIGSEGGGSRSVLWTAELLEAMHARYPDFKSHILAMSGVSGGGLGQSLFFVHHYTDVQPTPGDSAVLGTASADYLSPVTAALAFPDFLQRFLPIAIPRLDRARYIEDAWSNTYTQYAKNKIWDAPFESTAAADTQKPILILNGCKAESGQKVIITNMIPDPAFSPEAITFQDISKGTYQIPFKTAAFLTARFPYILPPASIYGPGNTYWGNIVDGGYYENSSLESLTQIYHTLIHSVPEDLLNHFEVVFIYFRNSTPYPEVKKSKNFLLEFLTPPRSLFYAWTRRSNTIAHLVEQRSLEIPAPYQFLEFQLNRNVLRDAEGRRNKSGTAVSLPLGWYLSPRASHEIHTQIREIFNWQTEDNSLWDETDLQNHSSKQRLDQILKK